MGQVTCHVTMSLDGFIAGPGQSAEAPMGVGAMPMHLWHRDLDPTAEADVAARDHLLRPQGAYIMGRNMFGPIRGEWSGDWNGWWGDEPPYHAPVFVLTHHEREPLVLEGGTTFHFVTGGFDAALAAARAAAGDSDIGIAGGASTIRQALAAGALEELHLDIAPVVLGTGEGLFTDGAPPLTQVAVAYSGRVIHAHYRVATS